MEKNNLVSKCRNLLRRYPVWGTLAIAIIYFALANLIGSAMIAMPEHISVYYLQQFLFIGLSLGFVLFFGYGWVYREKGFCKTLKILMLVVVVQGLLVIVTIGEAIKNPDSQWLEPMMLIVGAISLFEIGFSEESIFRGIVSNAIKEKYAVDTKGVWKSVIISGVIFGVVHMTNAFMGISFQAAFIQTMIGITLGMVFVAAYYRGKSIWALIFIHAITDTNSLFNSMFMKGGSNVSDINDLSLSSLIMVPVFIGFTAFLLRKKKIGEALEQSSGAN